VLRATGGLHKFMHWDRGLLTDSGGFQMVSLLDLADITEEGVTFQSPTTGERMLLTPEKSMEIQNAIGGDIMMALDDVVSSVHVGPERFEEATHRTLRWIDRCIASHARPTEQNLFAIVQGGLDPRLRDLCLRGLLERDAQLPGYAIGGLAGGEDKASFWKVIDQCTAALPANKPRYVMGVGYPLDIVVCSALGADMYDCVYPSRTARFGTALVPQGTLRLRQAAYAADSGPIDPSCTCLVCRTYSRAYLNASVTREPRASHLVTYHNLFYMQRFTREMRAAIEDGTFPEWVRAFVHAQKAQFPHGAVPDWVKDALRAAGIEL
jgi:tRNA-guanine transglycosylase